MALILRLLRRPWHVSQRSWQCGSTREACWKGALFIPVCLFVEEIGNSFPSFFWVLCTRPQSLYTSLYTSIHLNLYSLISIGSLFRRETSRATQFSPESCISAIGYLQYVWLCECCFQVFNPTALAMCKNSFIVEFPWPFYNEIFMCAYIHTQRKKLKN